MPNPLQLAFERFRDEAIKITKYFGLHVDGIEVTQATQHYRASDHLDRACRTGAPTTPSRWSRARRRWCGSISATARGGSLGVTGTADGRAAELAQAAPTLLATLAPLPPGSATAQGRSPLCRRTREPLAASLNFRIPAALRWASASG